MSRERELSGEACGGTAHDGSREKLRNATPDTIARTRQRMVIYYIFDGVAVGSL